MPIHTSLLANAGLSDRTLVSAEKMINNSGNHSSDKRQLPYAIALLANRGYLLFSRLLVSDILVEFALSVKM